MTKDIKDMEHICPKCLEIGMTIYRVFSLRRSSYIQKMIIVEKPYYHEKTQAWFCKYKNVKYDYNAEFSLKDAGIIPNDYNRHKTFIKEENAEKYLKEIKGED